MTVENCGRQVTVDKRPERVLALDPEAAMMLAEAGASDRISSYAGYTVEVPFGEAEGPVRAAQQLGGTGDLTRETIIGARPDVILGANYSFMLELADNGIQALIVSGYCQDVGQRASSKSFIAVRSWRASRPSATTRSSRSFPPTPPPGHWPSPVSSSWPNRSSRGSDLRHLGRGRVAASGPTDQVLRPEALEPFYGGETSCEREERRTMSGSKNPRTADNHGARRPTMDTSDRGRRDGTAVAEFERVVEGLAFVPERLPGTESARARQLLERDGAVILTGWPVEQDSTVRAAAAVLGARLRWLEAVQEQPTESWSIPLHTDGANAFIDVHGRRVRVRDHDIDYVLVLCDTQAPAGGESFICDGYRVVKRIREDVPDLYEFLTTVEVERGSGVEAPHVACMVEWTRRGRMVVRADPWARPYRRELHRKTHDRLLDRYADFLATLAAQAPDTLLAPGDILMLDNYRCPHGIRAHEGYRRTQVLRCKSSDAL